MKRSGRLGVETVYKTESDKFCIHPNDGFDLGLMTLQHQVQLHTGIPAEQFLKGETGTVLPANLELKNECPQHTLQMAHKTWEHLGKPEAVIIFYDNGRLFFHPG